MLQLHGSVPVPLLLQILQHLTRHSRSALDLTRSTVTEQSRGSDVVDGLAYTTLRQQLQTAQLIVTLLDYTMLAVQLPTRKRSSGLYAGTMYKPSETVTKDMIAIWDLNSPPVDELAQDKISLQLQAAAAALLELYPGSAHHSKKQVSLIVLCSCPLQNYLLGPITTLVLCCNSGNEEDLL